MFPKPLFISIFYPFFHLKGVRDFLNEPRRSISEATYMNARQHLDEFNFIAKIQLSLRIATIFRLPFCPARVFSKKKRNANNYSASRRSTMTMVEILNVKRLKGNKNHIYWKARRST